MTQHNAVDHILDLNSDQYKTIKWSTDPGSIGAGIAESDFGTAPAIRAALVDAVNHDFLTYLPESLALRARTAAANFLASRYDWQVSPDYVHIVNDVMAALEYTIKHYTPEGSAILVPTPSYTPFLKVPHGLGRPIIEVPMIHDGQEWRLNLDAIVAHAKAGAGLLVLCNPHNPLGIMLSREEGEALDAAISPYNIRVFADEIHAPIVYGDKKHVPYASISESTARQTITATACSKGWNVPGLKSAQIIFSNDDDLALWLDHDPSPRMLGSILGAVSTAVAYTDGVTWLDETINRFKSNRFILHRAIESSGLPIGYRCPDATYLGWFDLTEFTVDGRLDDFFKREAGVIVNDGRECGVAGEGHIRFNFALQPEVLRLAIDRMFDALKKL